MANDLDPAEARGGGPRARFNRRSALGLGLDVLLLLTTVEQSLADAIRRVAIFVPSTRAKENVTLRPFFAEMRRLGWIEGRNILYDWAVGDDQLDQMPRLAAEVVGGHPDVIYAPPAFPAVAVKRLTHTIPIVFGAVTDPVAAGLIANFAHPGENVTGVASIAGSLAPKRVELLHEIIPGASRVGMINDPRDPSGNVDSAAMREATQRLGLELFETEMLTESDIEEVFRRLIRQRVDAVVPTQFTLGFNLRSHLVQAALRARLPLVGPRTQFSDEGALLSFSSSQDDQLTRSAQVVDKILKGANPGDIPVEQPAVFELVINLKTARMLNIRVPQSLLLRADRLVE